MSNRRFIELSSSHRNRIQYPNPADFEVPFSPSRSLNTNQTLKGAYYNNNTSGNYSQIYNQSLDVADTITNGIIEYQWSGATQLYDTGTILSISVNTFPNYTFILSGLTKTYIGGTYYIVINETQISCTITGSTVTGSTVTILGSPISLIISVGLAVQINTNSTLTANPPNVTTSLGSLYIFDSSTLQSTNTSTTTNFYVNVSSLQSPYKNIINYYLGYLLIVKNGIAGIINSYDPTKGLFTVELPILTTQTLTAGDSVYIVDPSNATGLLIVLTANPGGGITSTSYTEPTQTIILPQIDDTGKTVLQYDQAYNGYYLIDETLSTSSGSPVYSQISSYNFLENRITLSTAISGWTNTDLYSIRKTLPSYFFKVSSTTLTPLPYSLSVVNSLPQLTIFSNCIFLPLTASSQDNTYIGNYIYLYPPKVLNNQLVSNTPLQNIEGSAFYINSYIGNLTIAGTSYRICYVTPLNNQYINSPTQFYPSYKVVPAITPLPGTVINIVSFKNDNYTPLIYNGSTVSQNETVAYEVSLVNLTLPNISLISGSRAAYYPYLYVQLSNVTASSSSSKNVIYSNNPNSYNALFLVPITDITDPLRSPFIKLDAGSMVQTIKFKPNDCLRFSVFLPSGEEYLTVMSDYYSPSAPNVLVQIDALFGIKRLTGV